MEIDTDSLYLALAERKLYDGIQKEKRQEQELLPIKD